MNGILERTHETAGLDEQNRTRYAISSVFHREGRTPLGLLFRYWNASRRGVDDLPRVADFTPHLNMPADAAAEVSWIDTRAESPSDFVMQDHRPNPIPGQGTELSGRPLSAYPNEMHAQALMMEYLFCKVMREPMYHEIDQIIGGVARHYLRLLVPVAGEDDEVARTYYAVRLLRQPVRLYNVENS